MRINKENLLIFHSTEEKMLEKNMPYLYMYKREKKKIVPNGFDLILHTKKSILQSPEYLEFWPEKI